MDAWRILPYFFQAGATDGVSNEGVFISAGHIAELLPETLKVAFLKVAFKEALLNPNPIVLTDHSHASKAARGGDVIGNQIVHGDLLRLGEMEEGELRGGIGRKVLQATEVALDMLMKCGA